MFGEACKGRILLFSSLQGNRTAASNSIGAGYAGSFLAKGTAGYREGGIPGSAILRLPRPILTSHCET